MEPRQTVKVLHVNNVDLYGRRFNGFDLMKDLSPRGIDCTQAVLSKLSDDPRVFPLIKGQADEALQQALARVEARHSMNNLLFPWGRQLLRTSQFGDADVVHYHLIHNQVISLFDLPLMFSSKPSVWTFHDPWPFTGHCIYPQGCDKWQTGCSGCPSLESTFPLSADCADRMWRVKQRVFANLDLDIVVASESMHDQTRRSPLTSHFNRVSLIPFGIDAGAYLEDEAKLASRRRLGIPDDDFVLFFRSTSSEYKGLEYIVEALGSRPPKRPTTLVTVDRCGLTQALSSDYGIVELGWVEDPDVYPRVFSACDVFLMPSTAEAFGLMALEAMAAGRPVICFEGTSLPSITRAPECGIAVPMRDSAALRTAIDRLSDDPSEVKRRGELGRVIARRDYSHDRYLDSLECLYRSAVERGAG